MFLNHSRVAKINKELLRRGFATWFDEEQLVGNLRNQLAHAIYRTKILIVFITRRYASKINSGKSTDMCFYTYDYAMQCLSDATNKFVIPVIMEKEMTDTKLWCDRLAGDLSATSYVDFSEAFETNDNNLFNKKCDELASCISLTLSTCDMRKYEERLLRIATSLDYSDAKLKRLHEEEAILFFEKAGCKRFRAICEKNNVSVNGEDLMEMINLEDLSFLKDDYPLFELKKVLKLLNVKQLPDECVDMNELSKIQQHEPELQTIAGLSRHFTELLDGIEQSQDLNERLFEYVEKATTTAIVQMELQEDPIGVTLANLLWKWWEYRRVILHVVGLVQEIEIDQVNLLVKRLEVKCNEEINTTIFQQRLRCYGEEFATCLISRLRQHLDVVGCVLATLSLLDWFVAIHDQRFLLEGLELIRILKQVFKTHSSQEQVIVKTISVLTKFFKASEIMRYINYRLDQELISTLTEVSLKINFPTVFQASCEAFTALLKHSDNHSLSDYFFTAKGNQFLEALLRSIKVHGQIFPNLVRQSVSFFLSFFLSLRFGRSYDSVFEKVVNTLHSFFCCGGDDNVTRGEHFLLFAHLSVKGMCFPLIISLIDASTHISAENIMQLVEDYSGEKDSVTWKFSIKLLLRKMKQLKFPLRDLKILKISLLEILRLEPGINIHELLEARYSKEEIIVTERFSFDELIEAGFQVQDFNPWSPSESAATYFYSQKPSLQVFEARCQAEATMYRILSNSQDRWIKSPSVEWLKEMVTNEGTSLSAPADQFTFFSFFPKIQRMSVFKLSIDGSNEEQTNGAVRGLSHELQEFNRPNYDSADLIFLFITRDDNIVGIKLSHGSLSLKKDDYFFIVNYRNYAACLPPINRCPCTVPQAYTYTSSSITFGNSVELRVSSNKNDLCIDLSNVSSGFSTPPGFSSREYFPSELVVKQIEIWKG